MKNGADLICGTLESLGVGHVFGVPGTQNVLLYEALRKSKIRSVLTTHELAASFMANGYYRASGRIAPLVTIPGPGFTYALTGLAEGMQDSAAILHIVGKPASRGAKKFVFQSLDQAAIAATLAKRVITIGRVEDIARLVAEAHDLALSGEPGPVVLQWSREVLAGIPTQPTDFPSPRETGDSARIESAVEEAASFLSAARKPFLLAGQGAFGAPEQVRRLAEMISSPVFTTGSGRGVLPEDHALSLGFDFNRSDTSVLNDMIGMSDCVIALGCKFSHLGTGDFTLDLPPDRLIHVDASKEVLCANYPARMAIQSTVEEFLDRFIPAARRLRGEAAGGWSDGEIGDWKRRMLSRRHAAVLEPTVYGVKPAVAGSFFAALRKALPRDGIVVTDSGLHQGLVRRHFDVLSPRGLIFPSDLQSMGFGLPAAIGAKLAAPERPVVAIIGDGGFAMSGMELLTAVREKIPLTVIVFNDARLNLIRLQQFTVFGASDGVDLLNPDYGMFAAAVGARYALIDGNAEEVLHDAVNSDQVTLVELRIGDSAQIRLEHAKGFARETTRRMLGPGLIRSVKRWMKRG